jgi:hypothetical protein
MKTVHLHVLVHGLWGNPRELDQVKQRLEHEGKLCLVIDRIQGKSLLGVELGGKLVADQLMDWVNEQENEKNTDVRVSFIAHSLGGLYSRYCLGILERLGWFSNNRIKLVNFVTLASPHLGAGQHRLRWGSTLTNSIIGIIAGQSGKDLLSEEFIEEIAQGDYLEALSKAENLVCYANLYFDLSVHFETAAIMRSRPNEETVEQSLVEGTKGKIVKLERTAQDNSANLIKNALEALERLDWKRYGVKDRVFFSHVDIIVKSSAINSYGQDILTHLISILHD